MAKTLEENLARQLRDSVESLHKQVASIDADIMRIVKAMQDLS